MMLTCSIGAPMAQMQNFGLGSPLALRVGLPEEEMRKPLVNLHLIPICGHQHFLKCTGRSFIPIGLADHLPAPMQ